MHGYCLSFVSWMILHFLWIFKFCENWIFQNCNFNRSAHINLSWIIDIQLYLLPQSQLQFIFWHEKLKKKCDYLKLLVHSLKCNLNTQLGMKWRKNKKIEIFGTVNSSYEKIPLLHWFFMPNRSLISHWFF